MVLINNHFLTEKILFLLSAYQIYFVFSQTKTQFFLYFWTLKILISLFFLF